MSKNVKKRKGFTLIELLAVIVILAVIALIATPIIMNAIGESKNGALKNSAYGYLSALEYYVAQTYNDDNQSNDINVNGTFDYTNNKDNIKSKGTQPTNVDVILENGKVKSGVITFNDKTVTIENGKVGEITDTTAVNSSKVYGVQFSGSTGTRLNDAVGLTYTVNTSTITSSFDTAEIYNEIVDNYVEDGNVFVKIPKFYISKTKVGANFTYKISKVKKDSSYYLPYSFYDEESGKVLPYVLIGKYNASLNGTKLESKSGSLPLVSQTIGTFRTYARNNNANGILGYQLLDIHAVDLLQTLFYVEFATLNSQSIIQGYTTGQYDATHKVASVSGNNITLATGKGAGYRVGQMIDVGTSLGGRQIAKNLRITAVNGDVITYEVVAGISTSGTIVAGNIVYNVSYLTGTTDSVATASGSPTSNADGKYSMKYRGIENFYGNIWQFVDGINIKDNKAYVATNPSYYASDTFLGAYSPLSYTNSLTNGNVQEMGYDVNNPFMQLPTLVGTNNYGDYYYQAAGNRIALLGGYWFNGSAAGASNWNLINVSGLTYLSIGSRVLKKAL